LEEVLALLAIKPYLLRVFLMDVCYNQVQGFLLHITEPLPALQVPLVKVCVQLTAQPELLPERWATLHRLMLEVFLVAVAQVVAVGLLLLLEVSVELSSNGLPHKEQT
jgi:hypothetical protein